VNMVVGVFKAKADVFGGSIYQRMLIEVLSEKYNVKCFDVPASFFP